MANKWYINRMEYYITTSKVNMSSISIFGNWYMKYIWQKGTQNSLHKSTVV